MEKIESSVAFVTLLFLVETKKLSKERKIAILEYNILNIKFT